MADHIDEHRDARAVDGDEERVRRREAVRQSLERALAPTKDVPADPPSSDLASSVDPALGTARDGRDPVRTASSAAEDVHRGDADDLGKEAAEAHDEAQRRA